MVHAPVLVTYISLFLTLDFELHEVEVKYGLLQLAEALMFLHADVKMIHGNLTPFNIYINKDGAWKVAGEEIIEKAKQTDSPRSTALYRHTNESKENQDETFGYMNTVTDMKLN